MGREGSKEEEGDEKQDYGDEQKTKEGQGVAKNQPSLQARIVFCLQCHKANGGVLVSCCSLQSMDLMRMGIVTPSSGSWWRYWFVNAGAKFRLDAVLLPGKLWRRLNEVYADFFYSAMCGVGDRCGDADDRCHRVGTEEGEGSGL